MCFGGGSPSILLEWRGLPRLVALLDREGVEVDVLHRRDAALLHQAAELRARDPLLLVALALA